MTATRFIAATWLAVAVAAGTTAARAQEGEKKRPDESSPSKAGESRELPLRIQENEAYSFRVTCDSSGAMPAPPDRPIEGKPKDGETTPPADAARGAMGGKEIEMTYRISAIGGGAAGEKTLSVVVRPSDGSARPDTARPTDDPADDKTLGDRNALMMKAFTVKLDSKGRITAVDGLEKIAPTDRPARPGLDAAIDEYAPIHVALIVGSGLHGMPLEKGQAYEVAGALSSGRTKPTDPAKDPGATPKTAGSDVCDARLRFEGSSGGDARFSIVDASNASARPLGQATYGTADGLLKRLTCVVPDDMSKGGPTRIGGKTRVSIERIGDSAVTEPPR
jgi:hypothetical protein